MRHTECENFMTRATGSALSALLRLSIVGFALTASAYSQGTVVGANCDLAAYGAKDTSAFQMFDRELRRAVKEHDAGRMALLVNYPLRVNDTRGAIYIKDAASLQGWYELIFTAKLEHIIENEQLASITCMSTGIVYGNGEIWVTLGDHGYAIAAINIPQQVRQTTQIGRIEFACRTDRNRVIVDIGADGAPRYRAWDHSHSTMLKPDAEVTSGKKSVEETSGCAHTIWSFKSGNSEIEVSELGCFPDSNQPPATATGQLSIRKGGKNEDWWWCY